MSKHKSKKATSTSKRANTTAGLRKALNARSKPELVKTSCWNWRRRTVEFFGSSPAPTELVAATRRAIADATDFDDRDMNTNFDYDYEADEEVKRNLARLIASGQLRLAMELSMELMKQGSRQVPNHHACL